MNIENFNDKFIDIVNEFISLGFEIEFNDGDESFCAFFDDLKIFIYPIDNINKINNNNNNDSNTLYVLIINEKSYCLFNNQNKSICNNFVLYYSDVNDNNGELLDLEDYKDNNIDENLNNIFDLLK